MFGLGITSFGLGAVGGYYKSLDRELRGKPLPRMYSVFITWLLLISYHYLSWRLVHGI